MIVYAVFLGALALSGAVLTSDGDRPARADRAARRPAALGIALPLAAAAWMPAEGTGRLRTAGAVLGGAVRDAISHVRSADPRLLGAFAWWGFDMAVLYGMLNAFGAAPPFAVVVLAYFLGQVANTVPVPGAASGGLVGVLLAFGVGRPGDRVRARLPRRWRSGSRRRSASSRSAGCAARWRAGRARTSRRFPRAPRAVPGPPPGRGPAAAWRPLEVPAAA